MIPMIPMHQVLKSASSIHPTLRGLLRSTLWALLLASASVAAAELRVQVVDESGEPAQDVAVIVRPRLPGDAAVPAVQPLPTVEITQENMRYAPALAIVTPGTVVRFTNRDPFAHHIHARGGAVFEYRVGGTRASATSKAANGPAQTVIEGGAGPVLLDCLMHSSMHAAIYVSDSPYFATTDAQGLARIAQVPPGPIELVLWHPQQFVEQAPQNASVSNAAVSTLNATLNIKLKRRRS